MILGGRNLELCLSAALELHDLEVGNTQVLVASLGTDGQDGPTDAAGAIVDSHAVSSPVVARTYLLNNDSYNYFQLENMEKYVMKTGLTGTNVMDVMFVLINFS